MGFSGFFFGHQWDPLGPITDAMTEIGILSRLFGSLTPLLLTVIIIRIKLEIYYGFDTTFETAFSIRFKLNLAEFCLRH